MIGAVLIRDAKFPPAERMKKRKLKKILQDKTSFFL